MIDESCIFCRIIAGEEMVSIVYEDDLTIAFMDIQPASPGHTLVVSREHYPTLFEVPDDLAAHCLAVVKKLAPGVRRAAGAAAVNIFSANGRAGGQDVLHFHLHMIPVREGEEFAVVSADGSVPLPPHVLATLTPGTLVRLVESEQGWTLVRDEIEEVPDGPAL